MNYSQINAYSFADTTTPTATTPTSGTSGTSSTSSPDNSEIKAKKKSTLDIQDFFKLLTAQMQNQSCLDPSSDTEYMSQMAAFSSLSAMQQLNTTATSQLSSMDTSMGVAYTQYASSLIGKTVTVEYMNEDQTKGTVSGVVDGVNFTDKGTKVVIGGKEYNLPLITKIENTAK